MGGCALITPVYLEIALISGARSGTQATGQVISAIDIADISIHALREEGDGTRHSGCTLLSIFLSTPSARRATLPRPPRGGRPSVSRFTSSISVFLSTPSARRATVAYIYGYSTSTISIHALREEGDLFPCAEQTGSTEFLSTPSARRATGIGTRIVEVQVISIHALREEGDGVESPLALAAPYISIHALREEGDRCGFCPYPGIKRNFYPRPPRGGRLQEQLTEFLAKYISIHALCEEGDTCYSGQQFAMCDFYPRPPRGGRRQGDGNHP